MSGDDADALRKAMEGFGTDEAALIKIVANRSSTQRVKIRDAYKAKFGRDLIEDLKKELPEVSLFIPIREYKTH